MEPPINTYCGLGHELAPVLLNGLSHKKIEMTIRILENTQVGAETNLEKLLAVIAAQPPSPNLNTHNWSREEIYEGMERT